MRFVRLEVDHFAAVEHAEVDFGPGLNVLHGPNDLGKSTLAVAIRAALLLPHSSADAKSFVPWQGDFTPEVQLTFADAGDRFWKVSKIFGGPRGSSYLESSKDGRDFVSEARGREVDERLRNLLEWGAPDAGGGARGLPQTFLAHTLLAEQTDVDAILNESLEADPAESGKLRLTRALQAFARDPRFKKFLDKAEAMFDQLFSPSGKPKRGRDSPFVKASEEVKRLRIELDDLDGQLRATDETESRLKVLREEVRDLLERRTEAEERLKGAQLRAVAKSALDAALQNLRGIEAAHATVGVKSRELEALSDAVSKQNEELAQAQAGEQVARNTLERAKESLLQTTSQKAASQRAIKKAELEKALTAIEKQELDLEARQKEAEQALALARNVVELEGHEEALEKTAKESRSLGEKAEEALKVARAARQQLRDLVSYGKWIEALRYLESMQLAREEAQQLTVRAAETRRAAAALRKGATEGALPDVDRVNAILKLDHDLRLAEAALGGGLSATVRPRKGVTVEIRSDDGEIRRSKKEVTVEASRAIELAIVDIADVRILAGDVAKRREADTLRTRWDAEVRPVLALAGLETGAALGEARAKADEALRRADALEKDAEHFAEKAAERNSRAVDLAGQEKRVAELSAALENCDREKLAEIMKSVGPRWEAEAERTEQDLAREENSARDDWAAASSQLAGVAGQLTQVRESLNRARSDSERARVVLGSEPEVRLGTIENEKKELTEKVAALRGELEKLDGAATKSMDAAKAREKKAEEDLNLATEAVKVADDRARLARSEQDKARGEIEILRKHADALPRAETEAEVRRCQAALSEAMGCEQPITETDIRGGRARLDELEAELGSKRAELNQAEGALTQVGGIVVRERHGALIAARDQAEERQRQLELDAEAWRLLRDTLRDSESAGAQHLGKALSGEVDRRFGELTDQRYSELDIDPHLRVQGVQSAGELRGIEALSAGTRDQLATLLRLAIAESLGTAIVLDDQLVQADPSRLEWFRTALHQAAALIQVVVLTCHRGDYAHDIAGEAVAARNVRYIDLTERIRRA
jgi:DNA repair exonuclease SbcCD ATPase subunit